MSDVRSPATRPLFNPAPQRDSLKCYFQTGGSLPDGGANGFALQKASTEDGDAVWVPTACRFPSDYDTLVLSLSCIAYYPQGGVAGNASFVGASGGDRQINWNGSTGWVIHTLDDGQVFTPDAPLTADILCVGGGGGGGGGDRGGGGNGGKCQTATTTISGPQTANVGAGGAGATVNETPGTAGGTTTFNGISAVGGAGGAGASGLGGDGSNGDFPATGTSGANGLVWTGDGICHAGGGGAGTGIGASRPPGGCGGGQGAGDGFGDWPASPGTDGLGGGGGGGSLQEVGQRGGNGVVKVRYSISAG